MFGFQSLARAVILWITLLVYCPLNACFDTSNVMMIGVRVTATILLCFLNSLIKYGGLSVENELLIDYLVK